MSDSERWAPEQPDWWNRLHQLWTWAVGKPEYNKKDWQDFEKDLLKLAGRRKANR